MQVYLPAAEGYGQDGPHPRRHSLEAKEMVTEHDDPAHGPACQAFPRTAESTIDSKPISHSHLVGDSDE